MGLPDDLQKLQDKAVASLGQSQTDMAAKQQADAAKLIADTHASDSAKQLVTDATAYLTALSAYFGLTPPAPVAPSAALKAMFPQKAGFDWLSLVTQILGMISQLPQFKKPPAPPAGAKAFTMPAIDWNALEAALIQALMLLAQSAK